MTEDASLCENYPLIKRKFLSEFGLILPKDLQASNKRKLLELSKNGPKKKANLSNVTSDGEPLDQYLLALIEIFTVNHTSFFRIKKQFEFLKSIVLPTLVKQLAKNNKKFKDWELVKISRLSVMPVPKPIWDEIIKISQG